MNFRKNERGGETGKEPISTIDIGMAILVRQYYFEVFFSSG